MLEPAGDGGLLPRAFLRVGGITIARHQLALALQMECQRIVCIARSVTSDVIDLQHQAERAGAGFHVIPGAPALVGQITANDEVIAFADGLLPNAVTGRTFLEAGQGVAVQPVEAGLAAGFERIDLDTATAGIMRIPGRLVERLAELPDDCDVVSALTRIALQAGLPMRRLPDAPADGAAWTIVRDEDEAQAVEKTWVAAHLATWGAMTPGLLVSRSGISALVPTLMHRGNGVQMVTILFLALLAMALGAGWLHFTATGLILAGMAWTVFKAIGVLRRIGIGSEGTFVTGIGDGQWFSWLVDFVFVMLLVWRAGQLPWSTLPDTILPPVMLTGLLRLLPAVFDRKWMVWLEDRALLAILLALFSALGVLGLGVAVLAVALLATGIALSGHSARLTRV